MALESGRTLSAKLAASSGSEQRERSEDWAWRAPCGHSAGVRMRHALPPHFVLSGRTVCLVTTAVIGLGSITGQCRQQVNTPC